jgi:nitrite reductase/ring-hydroxylating ferredoxin subunit
MDIKYIKVAKVEEFSDCNLRSVRIMGRPVAIFKDDNGGFRAMEAGCKHQNADITKGAIVDDIATCSWHGWKYDLRTGECLWGSDQKLRPYKCKVENGSIFISISPTEESMDSISDNNNF